MQKRIFPLLLCCLLLGSQYVLAQNVAKKNIVKINLTSLVFKNVSLQYERVLGKRSSIALGVSFAPKSDLPFAGTLKDQFGNNADAKRAIETTELGNFSITPEYRIYLSKKGAPNGFYFAPFVRYNRMTLEQLYSFTASDGRVYNPFITGTINNIGGGFLLGAQWSLGKSVTLDWWIAGPIYGSSNGDFTGKENMSTMSAADKQDLENDIEDVDIPLTKIEATVGNDRVDVKLSGPFVGLRAFGIALGFKF